MAISYASGWALRVTSSTTFSMAGALNKLPLSIFGMILFEHVTSTKLVSVLLACAAGLAYTVCREGSFS
jgi:GDP-mannose transporter